MEAEVKKKPKILLVYHSGSGSTKAIAEKLHEGFLLETEFKVCSANQKNLKLNYLEYDLFIFGFPVFYLKPSPSIQQFIERMPEFPDTKKAFLFLTKTVVSQNALRLLSKSLKKKNIITCGYMEFRTPSTDLSLILPYFLSRWLFEIKSSFIFGYEKNIHKKIINCIQKIKHILYSPEVKKRLPLIKWYSIIMNPIQKLFLDSFAKKKINLSILSERCSLCMECINDCERDCWKLVSGMPVHNAATCDFCLRCVHHCIRKAVIYSLSMKDHPRLDSRFYKSVNKKYLD